MSQLINATEENGWRVELLEYASSASYRNRLQHEDAVHGTRSLVLRMPLYRAVIHYQGRVEHGYADTSMVLTIDAENGHLLGYEILQNELKRKGIWIPGIIGLIVIALLVTAYALFRHYT
ncbi:MAG: hypothetical protein OWT27_09710 [Firmicutes bacterium]|nr:hypothetical protein [Bacillota bacterium]